MKALVTGGAGFIGSHLAERLLQDGGNLSPRFRRFNGGLHRDVSLLSELDGVLNQDEQSLLDAFFVLDDKVVIVEAVDVAD